MYFYSLKQIYFYPLKQMYFYLVIFAFCNRPHLSGTLELWRELAFWIVGIEKGFGGAVIGRPRPLLGMQHFLKSICYNSFNCSTTTNGHILLLSHLSTGKIMQMPVCTWTCLLKIGAPNHPGKGLDPPPNGHGQCPNELLYFLIGASLMHLFF